MINIMTACFARLRKSLIYKLCIIAIIIFTAMNISTAAKSDYKNALDQSYFDSGPFLSLVVPVFVSMFVGTEYSDGTIRNKLTVGCSRTQVYLGTLAVLLLSSLGFVAAWYLSGFVGLPHFGLWSQGIPALLLSLLISILFTFSLTALFCLLAFMITQKAAGAVTAIIIGLAMLFSASFIYNKLCEPEITNSAYIDDEGLHIGEPEPNPEYIGGTAREIYKTVLNSLPTGQAIILANNGAESDITEPITMIISSMAEIILLTAVGSAMFSKKDIK